MNQQQTPGQPAVFHVTHWKAGSQWVRGVLADACGERVVPLHPNHLTYLREPPLRPGGIYTPVYLNRGPFEESVGALPHRRFVVVRDLRDTLVSWYFSLKVSHAETLREVTAMRGELTAAGGDEAGLLHLMHDTRFGHVANIPKTWLGAPATPFVRYEEMLADEQGAFARIFEHCEIDLPAARRRAIVEAHAFERQSGRRRGQEDVASHYRKGVEGDWRNHFTPSITEVFKRHWGQLLIDLGYATDLNW